ncbi:MAG: hypothetical protein PVJ11_11780, partial [Syntrophobacterales bacterium]
MGSTDPYFSAFDADVCHFLFSEPARIFHELLAATTKLGPRTEGVGTERSAASANYMAVLPDVLGRRPLRRTVQVRLGPNTLRLPGGTPIFVVSRQQ